MTAIAHGSMSRDAGWPGRMRRVRSGTAHAVGCVLACVAVMAGGVHFADSADWSGLAHSRALLAASRMRAADAQRVLAAAAQPGDTGPAAGTNARVARPPAWPVLMLELADLAGASGLRVVSIEPRHADGAAPDGRRTVRIVADGGYPALLRMVGGLASFSALAVPSVLHIERKPPGLRVDMSVDVFPALSWGGAGDEAARVLASGGPGDDPFGGAGQPTAVDDQAPRLAGTIRDVRAGLALFDAGDGAFVAVAPGEALGASRVMRVDAGAVMLATADGARRFVVGNGGRP
ncbi:pilus assembly protein [Burkholderia sp. Bp9017]|uniref:Pilus assembly protein n=1 Tax=Burkholderia anthina TaxID=179879 RepID=A0A7T7AHI8_9BURK|nr:MULTISPECIES: pilus assembly protein [Burkholderia]MBY4865331.1 pilus assembly protein [Burkholderia anthina]QQK02896.1 pilus assembly protein [Burkholderia anthina]RQZ24888.1 pilus assembly protein [Burkholderia sp. Bp9017]RQZ32894.1 pilus assembly protein [Burkholderia sp. Bp9016]